MNKRRARWIAAVVGGSAAYFGAAQLGFALTLKTGVVSTIWLPTGLAVALLWVGGRSMWPAILIGEFAANTVHGTGAGISLVFACGDVIEALAARELLSAFRFRPELNRIRDVIVLLLPTAWIPTLIGATVGTGALMLVGGLPASSVWLTWRTWWFGDATGVIVVAPLLLSFWTHGISIPKGWRSVEVVAFALVLAPIAYVAAGDSPEIAFSALPILIWGALRFGQRGVTLANAVVASVGMAIVHHGDGLTSASRLARLLFTQDFLELAAITSLVLAAVMSQRERDTRQLQTTNAAAMALVEEQIHLGRIATAIAQERPLSEIFELITRSAGAMMGAFQASILRDDGHGDSTEVGQWTRRRGHEAVARCGGPGGHQVPINVHGTRWGCLWLDEVRTHPAAALAISPPQTDPTEAALERYARLASLAIASTTARQRLIELASTDALTGLANHRSFHERLTDEMIRCRRYERPVAVAIIDVDNFKGINDRLGHRAGDEVLAEVAARVMSVKRSEAMVARIGGDELAMVMPECDADTAAAAIERVRAAVSAEPIREGMTVTLSIGVCDSSHTEHPDQLLELADKALYEAKAAGRDLCMVYAT